MDNFRRGVHRVIARTRSHRIRLTRQTLPRPASRDILSMPASNHVSCIINIIAMGPTENSQGGKASSPTASRS